MSVLPLNLGKWGPRPFSRFEFLNAFLDRKYAVPGITQDQQCHMPGCPEPDQNMGFCLAFSLRVNPDIPFGANQAIPGLTTP